MTRTTQPSLTKAIADALRGPDRRVRPVDLPDGRRFWLKRVERMGLVLRLQKGDPKERFEAERQGLHVLGAAQLAELPARQ